MAGDSESAESAQAEAEMAWGFVVEADPGEDLGTADITYPSASYGVQLAYMLSLLGDRRTFFLHGYQPGDPLFCNDVEVEAVQPGALDRKLRESYVPPSLSGLPDLEVVPLPKFEWYCLRCREILFTVSEAYAAENSWAGLSGVVKKPFTVVSCVTCGYCDFYNMPIWEFNRKWDLEAFEVPG